MSTLAELLVAPLPPGSRRSRGASWRSAIEHRYAAAELFQQCGTKRCLDEVHPTKLEPQGVVSDSDGTDYIRALTNGRSAAGARGANLRGDRGHPPPPPPPPPPEVANLMSKERLRADGSVTGSPSPRACARRWVGGSTADVAPQSQRSLLGYPLPRGDRRDRGRLNCRDSQTVHLDHRQTMAINLDAVADFGDATELLDDVACHGLVGPRCNLDVQQIDEHLHTIEPPNPEPAAGPP